MPLRKAVESVNSSSFLSEEGKSHLGRLPPATSSLDVACPKLKSVRLPNFDMAREEVVGVVCFKSVFDGTEEFDGAGFDSLVLVPSAAPRSSTPRVCFKSSFRCLDRSLARRNRSAIVEEFIGVFVQIFFIFTYILSYDIMY